MSQPNTNIPDPDIPEDITTLLTRSYESIQFANEFATKLTDPNETLARSQAYFLDNKDNLKRAMKILNHMITYSNEFFDEFSEFSDTAEEAEKAIDNVKDAIAAYQKSLAIPNDIIQETPVITQETVEEAITNNKTTQEIQTNMEEIESDKQLLYNYMLVCDGEISMLTVPPNNKDELNATINKAVGNKQYKSVSLYEVSYTQVPLTTKTVYTIN